MLGEKKILGICVTKIHDRTRGDLVSRINYAACHAGYKTIVYNSFEDFFQKDSYGFGARSVYDRIEYGMLDGMIIFAQHFYDEEIVHGIAAKCKERNLPVVVIDGRIEGCISVRFDGTEAFREMLRHLFREHHVRKPFFLAGRREKDPNSEERLRCYREVLQEFDIPFLEDRVDYGEYWEEPAMRVTERLAKSGQLPDAMICANDSMAFGVFRKLQELGYAVPKDLIVTGFDGIAAVNYYSPRLTTCREDPDRMAQTVVSVFQKAFAGEETPVEYSIPYTVDISESCGCKKVEAQERMEDAATLYRYLEELEAHEDYVTAEVDRMLGLDALKELYKPLSHFIMQNSWICLEGEFIGRLEEEREDTEDVVSSVMVPSVFNTPHDIMEVGEGQVLPETEEWLTDDSCYILTSIYSKDIYCGYYVVRTNWINSVNYKIKKICRLANLVFNALINHFKQKKMMHDMENAVYLDALTGLPNLKGASKWFEEFTSKERNHARCLSMAVYAIPQYSFIYENYGMHEIEEVLTALSECLRGAYGRDCFLAKISENEFLVVHYGRISAEVIGWNEGVNALFQEKITNYNHQNAEKGKEYVIEVSYGCTVADAGWTGSLGAFVKYASNEMVLNRLKGEAENAKKKTVSEIDYIDVFNLLLENNLFTYHFQPIVDAKNGDVYGYEALMRTTGGISLTPMQILDAASASQRLDEVEHYTFFNILRKYDAEFEKFRGRKVFINTIPNHFISAEECEELNEKYQKYMGYVVFEVTEQDSSTDEEMYALRRFFGEDHEVNIAIDDFGTGHSNIVNLLRYEPQIIKIDHYLIHGIDADVNKQMFVKNTIEFAGMNGIKVLAEGVETSEELRTVIGFGVDLIQGFYTGRPHAEPIDLIEEKIRNEIIQENLRLSMYNNDKTKVYAAKDGEELNLIALALAKYTYVQISSGEVHLIGKKDSSVNLVIRVADNAAVRLNVTELNLAGTDEPAIQLGKGSNVEIVLHGYNTINKSGIRVPANAKLRIAGGGNLLVNSNDNSCVGIGSRYDEPYGEILLEHTGRIKIISSGDKIVGLGGGYGSSSIAIRSGHLEVAGSGISVLGIGSALGEAFIRIGDADVSIKESGNEAVGIGTHKGSVRLSSEGRLQVTADGERAVAVGSLYGNDCKMKLEKGSITATVHCDMGAVIGSYSGGAKLLCKDCILSVYGEGSQATGIGSSRGKCATEITGGIVDVKVLSGLGQPFGNEEDTIIITGGNVIARNEIDIPARNAYGQKLHREIIDADRYEKVIRTEFGEYVYTAGRNREHEILAVYLP